MKKAAAQKAAAGLEKVKDPKLSRAQILEIVHKELKPLFTDGQIDWILAKTNPSANHRRGSSWSTADVIIALTIALLSKRTYNHIRNKRLIPLPSMSFIRKHFQDFIIKEGHFDHVHSLMAVMATKMTDKQRICGLCFDEVHLKADISYNATHDNVIGPHSNANVLMVRGLYAKYKIPIFAAFDKAMTKKDLFEAIEGLYKAGFHVVTVTCDQGPNNTSLKKELGVTYKKPWFTNPVRPGSHIYFLHDVPHCFKNFSKWLRHGVRLGSGTVVGKPELQALLDKVTSGDGCEINPNSKLSQKMLDLKGQDNQCVRHATQLISQTTSDSINALFPFDPKMKELADLISEGNSWFDLFNSTVEYHKKNEIGHAYGLELEKQDQLLDQFYQKIDNLRTVLKDEEGNIVGYKKSHLPWQQGILMCCNAIKPLLKELQREYEDVKYILTYYINQDALEQTFSILRSMGGAYSDFGALEFLRRIRNLILGAGSDIIIEKCNVQPTEVSDFNINSVIDEELKIEIKPADSIVLRADDVVDLETSQSSSEIEKSINDSSENVADSDDEEMAMWDSLLAKFDEKEGEKEQNIEFQFPGKQIDEDAVEEMDLDDQADGEEDSTLENDDLDVEITEDDFDNILSGMEGLNRVQTSLAQDLGFVDLANELILKCKLNESAKSDTEGKQFCKDTLISDLKIMEKQFQVYHDGSGSKDKISRKENVTRELVERLQPIFPHYPLKLLKTFVMKRTLRRISHVCRKYIEHKKSQRGKNKVTSFVHSKPACEIEGESTTEGKGTKKVEGKRKSPAKEPSKCSQSKTECEIEGESTIEGKGTKKVEEKRKSRSKSKTECEIEGESTSEGKGSKKIEGKRKSRSKSKPACEIEGESISGGKGSKKIEGKRKSRSKSKPACEIEESSTSEGKDTKKVEGKRKSPVKEPTKRIKVTIQ